MKLSPRYTLILVSLGILLVVIVAVAVLVVPQFTKLSELDANIGSADEQIAQSQNLLRERQQAKDNAAFTDAALLELAAAVPETPDLPSLIIELQDIAYESNVQIRVIEPADLEQGEGFVTMPLTVQVWGAFADAVDFTQRLSELTRQLRLVDVKTTLLDESETLEAVEPLSPYSVETEILAESYVIPSAQESSATAPAPAPAP